MSRTVRDLPTLTTVTASDLFHVSDDADSLDKRTTAAFLGDYLFQNGGFNLKSENTSPLFELIKSDAAADTKKWFEEVTATTLRKGISTDAGTSPKYYMTITRTGNNLDQLDLNADLGIWSVNGSEKLRVDSAGVDITGALTVSTTLNVTTSITSPAYIVGEDGYIGIGASSERIVFDGSNNFIEILGASVGIGIISPDGTLHVHTGSAGTVTPVAVADDFIIENSTSGGMTILVPDADLSTIAFGTASDSVGALIQWDYTNSLMEIGTAKTGAEISLKTSNDVEAMRIDSSGNVGIGTSSPSYKLHISTTEGAGTVIARFDNLGNMDTGEITGIRMTANNISANSRYIDTFFEANTGKYGWGYGTNSTNLPISAGLSFADIVVDAGNVGIGNSGASHLLSVGDNLGTITSAKAITIGDGTNGGRLYIGEDNTTDYGLLTWNATSKSLVFSTRKSSTTYANTLTLDAGNVGIGTTNIDTILHVEENTTNTTTSAGITVENLGSGDAAVNWKISSQTYTAGIDNSDSDIWKLWAGSTVAMEVDTSGIVTLRGEYRTDTPSETTFQYKIKVLEIGAWNMDSTAYVDVTTNITGTMVGIQALVYNNDVTGLFPLDRGSSDTDTTRQGWHTVTTSGTIRLYRLTGGNFDSAGYNDAIMNRGLILITYF